MENLPVESNGKGWASLILGIFSLPAMLLPAVGIPVSLLGIFFGIKGCRAGKKGKAITGIVLSGLGLILAVATVFLASYYSSGNSPQPGHPQVSTYFIRDTPKSSDSAFANWPVMNSLSANPVAPGDVVTIFGTNFSAKKNDNFVKLLHDATGQIFEFYIPNSDNGTVVFSMPRNAPVGNYTLYFMVLSTGGYDVFRDFKIAGK
ncbi:MAG: DUF4190 domain-containing protein [Candidatus Paceibacterota bacterium]|jgi:hypothetical protein